MLHFPLEGIETCDVHLAAARDHAAGGNLHRVPLCHVNVLEEDVLDQFPVPDVALPRVHMDMGGCPIQLHHGDEVGLAANKRELAARAGLTQDGL